LAYAISSFVNWGLSFVVSQFYPYFFYTVMQEKVFWVFIAFQVFFLWYIYFEVPETKNKTILRIVEQFQHSEKSSSCDGEQWTESGGRRFQIVRLTDEE
jgi:hypothetical protein